MLDCFFLVDSCLVDLLAQVCPCVDGVGDDGNTRGAVVFGITNGSNALTQELESIERPRKTTATK